MYVHSPIIILQFTYLLLSNCYTMYCTIFPSSLPLSSLPPSVPLLPPSLCPSPPSLRPSPSLFPSSSPPPPPPSSCPQVVRQLISRKQAEIRQVRSGLTCFSDGRTQVEIKDIPGVCEWMCCTPRHTHSHMYTCILHIHSYMHTHMYSILLADGVQEIQGMWRRRAT